MTNEQKQINALREAVSGLAVFLRECVTGKDAQDACSAIVAELMLEPEPEPASKPEPAVIPEMVAFREYMAAEYPCVNNGSPTWLAHCKTWNACARVASVCCKPPTEGAIEAWGKILALVAHSDRKTADVVEQATSLRRKGSEPTAFQKCHARNEWPILCSPSGEYQLRVRTHYFNAGISAVASLDPPFSRGKILALKEPEPQ